jgi:hypothetical protein
MGIISCFRDLRQIYWCAMKIKYNDVWEALRTVPGMFIFFDKLYLLLLIVNVQLYDFKTIFCWLD